MGRKRGGMVVLFMNRRGKANRMREGRKRMESINSNAPVSQVVSKNGFARRALGSKTVWLWSFFSGETRNKYSCCTGSCPPLLAVVTGCKFLDSFQLRKDGNRKRNGNHHGQRRLCFFMAYIMWDGFWSWNGQMWDHINSISVILEGIYAATETLPVSR